jgi:hypothetical protein
MSEQTIWEKNLADDDFCEIHEDACCNSCGWGTCGQQTELENGDFIFENCDCECEEAIKRNEIHTEYLKTIETAEA